MVLVSGKQERQIISRVDSINIFASTLGFIVFKAKFKNRGNGEWPCAETSSDVLSGLFDSLVSELVELVRMTHGSNADDVDYTAVEQQVLYQLHWMLIVCHRWQA